MGDGQNVRDGSSDDSFTGSNPIFQGNQVRGVAGLDCYRVFQKYCVYLSNISKQFGWFIQIES